MKSGNGTFRDGIRWHLFFLHVFIFLEFTIFSYTQGEYAFALLLPRQDFSMTSLGLLEKLAKSVKLVLCFLYQDLSVV